MTLQSIFHLAFHSAKDPVCGMDVHKKSAAVHLEYQGKTYYFCSPGCQQAFDEYPAKYIGRSSQKSGHHSGHQHCH